MMLRRCPEHPEIASAVEGSLWWVPGSGNWNAAGGNEEYEDESAFTQS